MNRRSLPLYQRHLQLLFSFFRLSVDHVELIELFSGFCHGFFIGNRVAAINRLSFVARPFSWRRCERHRRAPDSGQRFSGNHVDAIADFLDQLTIGRPNLRSQPGLNTRRQPRPPECLDLFTVTVKQPRNYPSGGFLLRFGCSNCCSMISRKRTVSGKLRPSRFFVSPGSRGSQPRPFKST